MRGKVVMRGEGSEYPDGGEYPDPEGGKVCLRSRPGLTHRLRLGDGKVGGRRVLEGHDQVSVEQSVQHHLLQRVWSQ